MGQSTLLLFGAVCVGGVREGTMPLASLLGSCPTFCYFPCFPQVNGALSGADSWVGGFVYILGPWGSLQQTLLWGWEFLPPLQPPQVFTARGFEALFPHAVTLGWKVCLTPQLFLPVNPHTSVGPPASASPTGSSSHCLATHPFCPSCPSLPLLPVWMNVSSLPPWLSDFHTVWFSVSFGCFLFLNLLSSFWLCEKAKCISLCLNLGQKSPSHTKINNLIMWFGKWCCSYWQHKV